MKKKFLSIALAGTIAFGGGFLLAGCGGEDQNKLHNVFLSANSSMALYGGEITYVCTEDGKLSEEGTYDPAVKKFAYISYDEQGSISEYDATKRLYSGDLAYYSEEGQKFIDLPYLAMLLEEKILENAVSDISLDYAGYKAYIDAEVAEFKQDLIEDGFKINKISCDIEYKTVGEERYNAQTVLSYDYEDIKNGEGLQYKYQQTTNAEFSDDWIYSITQNYSSEQIRYNGGKAETPQSQSGVSVQSFSKGFDREIYLKPGVDYQPLPTEAEHTNLVFIFGQEASPVQQVPFNVDLQEEAKRLSPLETGMTYAFYLDETLSTPIPEGYQLSTQKDNVIYAKVVLAEGYTQIEEIYQDSTGVRGSKKSIIRLDSEFAFNKVYDSKTFSGEIYVDGDYVTSSMYVFKTGESHTILYKVDYNVDIVTQAQITFYLAGKYYFIEEGTPGEQTLGRYFDSLNLKIDGVSIVSSAFDLEIKSYDGSTCTLDDSLMDIKPTSYTITSSVKKGYVVVKDTFGKSVAQANDMEIIFKFNAWSQKLRIKVDGSIYDYTRFGEKFGIVTLITEDEEGNTTVKLLGGFKEDKAYYLYVY